MPLRRTPLKRGKPPRRGGKLKPVNKERRAKRRANYTQYLRSPEWTSKRAAVLTRDGHRCQRCGSGNRLEVHHAHYQRFGAENLDDLITYCHACHMAVEAELRPWNRGRL